MGIRLRRKDSLGLLSKTDRLPSLPCILLEVQAVMNNPESGIMDLVDVIKKDQSTSAMILKYANSAVYNVSGKKYSNINDAVVRLGMTQASNVANAMGLMQGLMFPADEEEIELFWMHCFGVALMSKMIALKVDPQEKTMKHEDVFMVGLLHEIGRVAIASNVDYCYFSSGIALLSGHEAALYEKEHYGVTHHEAAGFIMRAWMFPDVLIESVEQMQGGDNPIACVCRSAENIVNNIEKPFTSFNEIIDEVAQKAFQMEPEGLLCNI
ncbi:MAG: HDOD domain-containing protein [Mariprofundaceae bacterium]|nr:HDOD domain-containing protein [Mariprofundaceae bacterium]